MRRCHYIYTYVYISLFPLHFHSIFAEYFLSFYQNPSLTRLHCIKWEAVSKIQSFPLAAMKYVSLIILCDYLSCIFRDGSKSSALSFILIRYLSGFIYLFIFVWAAVLQVF